MAFELSSEVVEAVHIAADHAMALAVLQELRQRDGEQFIHSISLLHKRNPTAAAYVYVKLRLTQNERWNLAIDLYASNAISYGDLMAIYSALGGDVNEQANKLG